MAWMTRRAAPLAGLALALLTALPDATRAAGYDDPDWPCIQRKVPHLSVGQMWAGPPIDAAALDDWRKTPELAALAPALAAQRTSMDAARAAIDAYAARGADSADRPGRLSLLFAGIFASIERERSAIIDGIARYARKQAGLATRIAAMRDALAAARAAENPDLDKVEELEDNLKWEERIYADRAKSLTYVCEAPVILEQRVFALARLIMAHLD